ncbi:DUF5659 domain-containing protein [Bacillus benzoevorans]|uniref:DUF5659 domain-containing protein n=1 Tax=Bacillus benzoevorans TaxID=1456 RepID=A0A7X0HTW2_9BACI|nr:DUF5659 domain-containing protein [Bacillus benzoevorans]MBB6445625.1 hypothetical protein [Bacillus benzoevorans]
MKNYFFCYNKKVSDFLKTKGIYYITVAQDVKTLKIFSLFEITPSFQQALEEYKNQSK